MKNVVVVRYSEIAVKGRKTRNEMERLLINNMKDALKTKKCKGKFLRKDGRIIVESPEPDPLKVAKVISKVFGVKSVSPAIMTEFSNFKDLIEKALQYFSADIKGRIFAVRARRVGSHSFTSKDVEKALGKKLLETGGKGVDLERPEFIAYVEIRDYVAYFYKDIIRGPGGLPLGSEDPVLVLFSGGFDSTVSVWLLMKRGSPITLLTFYPNIPEFLERSLQIAGFLNNEWSFGHEIEFCVADISNIVNILKSKVRKDYRVLVLRKIMAEYARQIAEEKKLKVLATGESVGQVASQTINNIRLIWENIGIPVLRPVIGLDKDEIMKISKEIDVYDLVSKQIEPCGMLGSPDPKASSDIFYNEYNKTKKFLENLKYKCIEMSNVKLEKILKTCNELDKASDTRRPSIC